MNPLRRRWEKNWPEIRGALGGGFPDFVFARRPEVPAEIPVFWYHSVLPEEFREDLLFLERNGYRTVTADELRDHVEGRRPCPPRSVVLSFDDGSVNLHSVVFPLLQEFSRTAVAFIAPAFHELEEGLPSTLKRPCSWGEILEMHESGRVDFQSHTLEHRYLPRWPEPLELADIDARYQAVRAEPVSLESDLAGARNEIRERLGKEAVHLAFPRFDGTAEAVATGIRCGYRAFWWGAHATPPIRVAGGVGTHVSRVSGEFLRRLPGEGRLGLGTILRRRYTRAARGLVVGG